MELSTIIVAVISLIGTLTGAYLANSKTAALLGYRIEQLEKKVEKHNSIIERTYKLEKDMATVCVHIDEIRTELNKIA